MLRRIYRTPRHCLVGGDRVGKRQGRKRSVPVHIRANYPVGGDYGKRHAFRCPTCHSLGWYADGTLDDPTR